MGSEKRFFARHPISLKARCTVPGSADRAIEIRDFCPGGMFFVYDAEAGKQGSYPRTGDLVDIQCSVPTPAGQQRLTFRGTIARAGGNSAGIAFVGPHTASVRLLQDFAEKVQAATRAELKPAEGPDIDRAAAAEILLGCKRIAGARLDPLINAFNAHVGESLHALADRARSDIERNLYFHAMNTLKKKAELIRQRFDASMRETLARFPEQVQKRPVTAKDAPAEVESELDLSLVEKNEFEEWLQFTSIARKVEAANQRQLIDLEQRLSALCMIAVHRDNNAFGASVFSHAFADALEDIPLEKIALNSACAAFADVLGAEASELYERLNQHLIEQGVLSDLTRKRVYRKEKQHVWGPRVYGAQAAPAATPDGQAAAARTHPYTVTSEAAEIPVPPAWYDLAQELRSLQQRASLLGPSLPLRQYFTPEELLQALSRIHAGEVRAPGEHYLRDLRELLQGALPGSPDEAGQKAVSPRESRIIEIFGALLEALLGDDLISNRVKPWLQDLSVPLLKLAIRDDTLLSDPTHLARQLINQIVKFESYGEESPGAWSIIGARINELVTELKSSELTLDSIRKTLKEMNLVLHVQDKVYEENVDEVRTECEQEQPDDAAPAGPEPEDAAPAEGAAPAAPPAEAVPQAWESDPATENLRKWKERLARLKLGTWMLFEVETAPQRVRLAWISHDRDQYVFVDVKGLKHSTLTRNELAWQLSSGASVILDSGEAHALDRAQFATLQKMHQRLLHEMAHDQLTGLVNRRHFETIVRAALREAWQGSHLHAVCSLELPEFSAVHNAVGQETGDRILAELADLLRKQINKDDVLARFGGDEFGILFRGCPVSHAASMLERIRDAVQAYRFVDDAQHPTLSFSAGVVGLTQESPEVEIVMEALDVSRRIARDKGRNFIQVCEPGDDIAYTAPRMMAWASRIDEILANDAFELRYQPVVDIAQKAMPIRHSEILLGVPDGSGKLVSPADLIVAGRHLRRLPEIDRWVIARVFEWMATYSDKLAEVGGFAIKVSASSLNEVGFAQYVIDEAKRHGAPLDRICFEVTETADIANLSTAADFIWRLKDAGCSFSLAEFGSGSSSYAYLKNLPVNFLKINGNFVRNVDNNDSDLAVVKSITEIGHFMGKQVIAEHVESDAILKLMREVGVDYAQGHAIATPHVLREVENKALFLLRQLKGMRYAGR